MRFNNSIVGMVQLEIVYATPERQSLVEICVDEGTTCAEAIRQSGISDSFPADDLVALPIAIWGRIVLPDACPADRDRIEILRPLVIDPRETRRELAQTGRFMGGTGDAP